MAFLDLEEGLAELFSDGNSVIEQRRTESDARHWFMQNRIGRHHYVSPLKPLAAKSTCSQCWRSFSSEHALRLHAQSHAEPRQPVVTCCACRVAFTGNGDFHNHFSEKHWDAHLAASRINIRLDRARRKAA